ncbi:MAG: hypothetical protein HYX67_00220 [Candidatus Melainabacteria bacterium]|nr:hypothetical protein [Candidatus Melainabacteria bacterium]
MVAQGDALTMQNKQLSALLSALLMTCPTVALAADWGYDESKQPTELKASPAKSLHPKSANPFARTPSPSATSGAAPTSDSDTPVPLKATPSTLTLSPRPRLFPKVRRLPKPNQRQVPEKAAPWKIGLNYLNLSPKNRSRQSKNPDTVRLSPIN